jgi:hypothetical protein
LAAKKQQTHAKRARELAVKERRERKRAKKAERAAGVPEPGFEGENGSQPTEGQTEIEAAPDWIR